MHELTLQELSNSSLYVRESSRFAAFRLCLKEYAQQTISNWMRNRMTLEYFGLWEELYNPDFKPLGFEGFRKEVGFNHFSRCVFSQKLMGESF